MALLALGGSRQDIATKVDRWRTQRTLLIWAVFMAIASGVITRLNS